MTDKCPECNSPYYGNGCKCGWKKAPTPTKADPSTHVECQHGVWAQRCSFWVDGERCKAPGVFSPSTVGGDTWYCREHARVR